MSRSGAALGSRPAIYPSLGPQQELPITLWACGVGAAESVRFAYTQKVPSEAAFHDTANGHFLLLLLLALLASLSGG